MDWEVLKFHITFTIQMIYFGLIEQFIGKFYNRYHLRNKTGFIAVVTGGTRGIGTGIIKQLLQCDMHVILGCRKIEDGKKLEQAIRNEGLRHGSLDFLQLDLQSFESVKNFGKAVTEKYPKINILINNAATAISHYELMENDIELQMGVNHYSSFLLIHMLMPSLIAAGKEGKYKSRIVNVSSCAHRAVEIDFDDLKLHKGPINANYSKSKLAQILITKYLARKFEVREEPVLAYSVHPGLVKTDIQTASPIHQLCPLFTKTFYKDIKYGALPVVYAAIDEKLEAHNGAYISNCRILSVNPFATYEENQKKMYEESIKILGIKEFGKP